MKLNDVKLGNLHLIYLRGSDGIVNIKAELPKEEYRDNEVVALPHYKPLTKIDHYSYKRKINKKIEEVEGVPIGFLDLKFNVRVSGSKSIMFIPVLRAQTCVI